MSNRPAPSHIPVVVIPNLNGGGDLLDAIASLEKQTLKPHIIVVDNASTDGSADAALAKFPGIELIRHTKNFGYAGGVNPGLRRAIESGATYVAPFNDDAVADEHWLQNLVDFLNSHDEYGSVMCKVLHADGKTLDSTGDYLTNWGLPYPRGRNELDGGRYDGQHDIFAASGAASLYRIKALEQVGLFDEDFFAYYEDVDLGFRMQLAGWKVGFEPAARVYHKIGMTSGRIKGFTTLQTLKNQPLVIWKNLPRRFLFRVLPRFTLAYLLFFGRALSRGHIWPAFKGGSLAAWYTITKLPTRWRIQKNRVVPDEYIWSLIVHDLPPNAHALRRLRQRWWKIIGKKEAK